ncbi:MAG: Sigma-24 [Bacteroidota bacterium]|jgi:RNA polymerase sigma-70 factor (ECF subfamily)
MTEQDLINQIKLGNHAAFNELVKQHSKHVIQICHKFVLKQQDAEDIAQEVFIEVYQSIKSFRGESKLSTWIYRIAVTKCLDDIKKRNRKKRLAAFGKIFGLEDVIQWLVGGEMPDKALLENEKRTEIMQALNTLPDNQRIAFTLSKIDGYSNAEIAAIMETTILAVEALVKRAKKQVSTALEIILKNKD